ILHRLLSESGARGAADFASDLDDTEFVVVEHRGAWLRLPAERVHAIVSTLIELFDPRLALADGALRLSGLRAHEIEALDRRSGGVGWHDDARARLAEQLERVRSFTGAQARPAPDGFQAVLRPYQESGLGWLQALARLGLGGILADDMGLGKTVQTLAHLVVEKQTGRQRAPSMVVAPTSVIANWAQEARRFSPQLRVLVLHGPSRRERFEAIEEHDLVITTYALARRDRDRLAEHAFHYLVLDEAQAIKNARAKARQSLMSLSAEHRLCLTGTPLENHLGELWSLVDFVEPDVLGDERQFRRIFRRPIERDGDAERAKLLAGRLAPLLLRRTKQEIDDELPDKVEIAQAIELHADQRDLYETVRVSMDRKVRQALAKQGFEQSRIVVLDALLKLRQICCHPKLVKLDAARKVLHSAKLDRLIELLLEMIDEGRRVLVFSQFTAMLALIEAQLEAAGIAYAKLTGRTRDRTKPVERFQSGTVPVFLISLKAGGTGLNLTAADTVIHYDPWWNPAVEAQATDRAHRIGQDKTVFVYKLITASSVESRMLDLQARKRELAGSLLDEAGSFAGSDLRAEDLDLLFQPLD
ncbi:MAG: DEAD/DEAH box helicase, partial [Gammaproteobacteria bacterium]